ALPLVCSDLRESTAAPSLSLRDALPIFHVRRECPRGPAKDGMGRLIRRGRLLLAVGCRGGRVGGHGRRLGGQRGRPGGELARRRDRKSTRLNSSHVKISYAVFCLKKKNS